MPRSKVEWLIRTGDVERAVAVSDRMTIEDASWRATIERFEPAEGIWVFLSSADIHREVVFDTHQHEVEPRLLSQIPVRGNARLAFADGVAVDVGATRSALFLPARRRGIFTLQPQKGLRHAGLSIAVDRVRQMFGDELPPEIESLIGDYGATRLVEAASSLAIRRLAASLFADTLRGSLRMMFMEGVALQLLAMQAAAAAQGGRARSRHPGRPARGVVEAAHQQLLADMADPPSLGALAAAAGISGKALNAGFRRLYGGTVFEVLRDERLEHARIALEGSDVPIKQIAHRVGYSHVSNFTAAFTRRYGVSPARYLRRRSGEADSAA